MQQIREVEARIQSAIHCLMRMPTFDARHIRALKGSISSWPSVPEPAMYSKDWWLKYGTEGAAGKLKAEVHRGRQLASLSPKEIAEMDEVICRWLPLLAQGRLPKRMIVEGDGKMSVHWVCVPNDAARIVFLRGLGKSLNQIMGNRPQLSYGKGGNSKTQIGRVHRACLRWLAEQIPSLERAS